MESELERFHKQNTNLELNIEELKLKLKATEKEMYLERQKVNFFALFFLHFKTLSLLCGFVLKQLRVLAGNAWVVSSNPARFAMKHYRRGK